MIEYLHKRIGDMNESKTQNLIKFFFAVPKLFHSNVLVFYSFVFGTISFSCLSSNEERFGDAFVFI